MPAKSKGHKSKSNRQVRRRASGGRPLISLCMIVRDSSQTLRECLSSIRPWVDEIVVVDTGSTDDTPSIAASLGARVFEFPWCDDFSAARNESLRHARGRWIFWMDADDTMPPENGPKLRPLVDHAATEVPIGHVVQVHCPAFQSDGSYSFTAVDHVKLFPNHPQMRFEGRIHEQVLPSIRRLGGELRWTDLFVVHSGSDQSPEGRQAKYQRDLRILQRELEEKPDHPFVLFNLGMTYADMEEYATAAGFLEHCITVSSPDESHLRKAFALLVAADTQQQHLERAWQICEQGRQLYPDDPELLFREAILHHQFGRLGEAAASYLRTLAPRRERYLASIDPGICGFKARHNLALVYADQGRHDLAEVQLRQVLEQQPQFRPAWRELVTSLIHQGRTTSAEIEIDRMAQNPKLRTEAAGLQVSLWEKEGHIDDARQQLMALRSEHPEDLDLLKHGSRFLFDHGPYAAAVSFLSELCWRSPKDGAAYHNLGTVYRQGGCITMAADAFRNSLKVRPPSPNTAIQLAECLEALGEIQQAIATLQAARSHSPDDRAIQACLTRLGPG